MLLSVGLFNFAWTNANYFNPRKIQFLVGLSQASAEPPRTQNDLVLVQRTTILVQGHSVLRRPGLSFVVPNGWFGMFDVRAAWAVRLIANTFHFNCVKFPFKYSSSGFWRFKNYETGLKSILRIQSIANCLRVIQRRTRNTSGPLPDQN